MDDPTPPRFRHRTKAVYGCVWCGRQFNPTRASRRLYCGRFCSGRANSARAAKMRKLLPLPKPILLRGDPDEAIEAQMRAGLNALEEWVNR